MKPTYSVLDTPMNDRTNRLHVILDAAGVAGGLRYPTDLLSRVVSRIWRELADTEAAYEDLDRWGAPGECHRDVTRAMTGRITAILRANGLTAEEYNALLEARVSGKWLFTTGLLLDELDYQVLIDERLAIWTTPGGNINITALLRDYGTTWLALKNDSTAGMMGREQVLPEVLHACVRRALHRNWQLAMQRRRRQRSHELEVA